MALLVYGHRQLVSEKVIAYSFSQSSDGSDLVGVVLMEPGDPNGYKIFPLTAPLLMGEAVLRKALIAFRSTGNWPETVSHFS
ncbi:hypothetical protein [Pseudolysinimonas sp.]